MPATPDQDENQTSIESSEADLHANSIVRNNGKTMARKSS